MARLSTGKAYGNTGRRTPQQLLGGTDATAVQGGELAQRQLQAPAIQPQAQLTNTFIQAGAPTLGGPVRMFEPPALPAPSRDMANLASALSSFNPALRQVGEAYYEEQQAKEKLAKERGQALAQQLADVGGGSLQEVQKRLEKGAAEGMAGYDALLRRFQVSDKRTLFYADYYTQLAATEGAVATFPERWKRTQKLMDGRDRSTVSPDDPEVRATMAATFFPGGVGGIHPLVYAERSQQIGAAFGTGLVTQEKDYALHKKGLAKTSLSGYRDSNALQMTTAGYDPVAGAATLSQAHNDLYERSGLTTDDYQQEKEQLVPNMVDAVIAAAGGDYSKLQQGKVNLMKTLERLQIGPLNPDGTRPLLFAEDGYAGILRSVEKIDKRLLEMQELGDKIDRRDGLETADIVIAQLFTPEVMSSPQLIVQATDQAKAYGIRTFGEGSEKFLAFMERVNAVTKGVDESLLAPIQREAGFQLEREMAQNPDVDFTEKITQYRDARLISDSDARSLMRQQSSRNDQKNRLNYDHLKTLDADLNARLTANAMRGDGLVDPEEFKEIQQARIALRRRGVDMIMQAQGADITEQLSGVWSKGVEAMMENATKNPVQTRPPATPQEVRKALAPGSRGNDNQNKALRRRLETERVFTRESLLQELVNLDAGKPLSNEMKEIIRRSGLKPSEALLNQMKMHGIEVRPEEQQHMQKLDGSDLVSQAPPPSQPNRFVGMAANLSNQLARGVMDTLTLSAPAQARGSSPFSGSGIVPRNLQGLSQLIGGVESYGGNYGAFNRGGSDGGHTAHGSGVDRNLVNMTIAEIQRRQLAPGVPRNQQLHAVGKYQIIGPTLQSLLAGRYGPTGVKPTDKFTPAVQERLFAALAKNRLVPGNVAASMRGLRQEWIGLQNVPDSQLRPVVEALLRG